MRDSDTAAQAGSSRVRRRAEARLPRTLPTGPRIFGQVVGFAAGIGVAVTIILTAFILELPGPKQGSFPGLFILGYGFAFLALLAPAMILRSVMHGLRRDGRRDAALVGGICGLACYLVPFYPVVLGWRHELPIWHELATWALAGLCAGLVWFAVERALARRHLARHPAAPIRQEGALRRPWAQQ